MCGPEPPTNLDWGPQGSGKHVEAQAGLPGAKAATDYAYLQRVGCKRPQIAEKSWRWDSRLGWGRSTLHGDLRVLLEPI